MLVHTITVGPFFENCFLVADEKTKECWIIDPGAEGSRIRAEIQRLGPKPRKILLTHAHGDHIGAVEELRKFYNIPVFIHEKDHPLLIDAEENLSAAFGSSCLDRVITSLASFKATIAAFAAPPLPRMTTVLFLGSKETVARAARTP